MMVIWMSFALAQDPDFSETEKEAEVVEQAEADLSAEISGSLTGGNTNFYTVSAALGGGYRWKANRLSMHGAALWGQGRTDSDGDGTLSTTERNASPVETARRLSADGRYDRFFGDRNSLYVLAGALVDPFAGYDLRTHEQIGYSRHLVANDSTNLIGELGVDYAQENYVDGVDPNTLQVVAARMMLGLSHKLDEKTAFEDTVEVFESVMDPADVRINNIASFSTSLADGLSLKLSHETRFDNVPVEGFAPVDHTLLATLVATFL